MSKDEFMSLGYLINPNADWSGVDYHHLNSLTIDIKPDISRQKIREIVGSTYWPEAVSPTLIVNTLEERQRRAKAIVTSYCGNDLKNKRFLDFGCGNGDCVKAAKSLGASAVGFDVVEHADWVDGNFTTDFDSLLEKGPYDSIIIYNVVDYMVSEHVSHLGMLRILPKLLKEKGLIYVRCSPYSARIVDELYLVNNKAYAHLFLDYAGIKNRMSVIDPSKVYPAMFSRLGFSVEKIVRIKTNLEPIIRTMIPAILPNIKDMWTQSGITDQQSIIDIMEIQYIDLVLRL